MIGSYDRAAMNSRKLFIDRAISQEFVVPIVQIVEYW